MRLYIIVVSVLALGLTACHQANTDTVASNAPLCAMLKPNLEADQYKTNDPSTMQRKTAIDQAKLIKEYDSYNCPEIIDEAPLP